MKNYPERRKVYTLEQVDKLDLGDTPHLNVVIDGEFQVIQTSHVALSDLLANPLWAQSKWEFILETFEWIPIFHYRGDVSILGDLVDVEPRLDPHAKDMDRDTLYVTPKGFPRAQYYTLEEVDGEYKIKKPSPLFTESPYYLLPELTLRDGKHPMVRKNLRICPKCNCTYESSTQHLCEIAG